MATEILFPMYELLVENIFGSVGFAILGVYLAIILILFFTRNTSTFIAYWSIFYFMVMAVFYIGSLGLIFGFMITAAITVYNILKLFGREG